MLVVGAGEVGGFYAERWARAGHAVTLTFARDDAHAAALAERVGAGWQDAATDVRPDVVLLAVRLEHLAEARRHTGPLTGVVLLDAVNPFLPDRTGLVALDGRTAADLVRAAWPQVRHVKALHSIGVQRVRDAAGPVAAFVAGDDDGATQVAERLTRDAGLLPVRTGGLATAAWSEPPGPLFSQAWSEAEARARLDDLVR